MKKKEMIEKRRKEKDRDKSKQGRVENKNYDCSCDQILIRDKIHTVYKFFKIEIIDKQQ